MGEMGSRDEESESKMYDLIISKVMSNPRIDKRTLLRKFISKIEMESNNNTGLSSELSQIKKMMEKEPTDPEQIINGNLPKQHASSQLEQQAPQLLESAENAREGAQSLQQIVLAQGAFDNQHSHHEEDSEILLNVPSETMAGQVGVQNARPSRDTKRPKPQKPLSAKLNAAGRDQKSRIDTSTRTRSSSHNMKSSANKQGNANQSHKRSHQAKVTEQKDYRKVKSYLEEESLFKDIERSTEYQDPLNLNVMDQSANTESAPVDPEDIQLEQKSSQKSQSRSNSRKKYPQHHSSIQSSDQNQRNNVKDGQSSSNRKSFTISRPSTAITNGTRYSSVNLRKGRRRQHAQNQMHPQKTLIAKELEDPMRQSRSESSSRGRYQKYQTRYSQNRASAEPKDQIAATNSNFNQNAKITGQQKLKHSQARKRLSVNHHQTNFAHGQSVEHKPLQNDSRVLNKVSTKKLAGNKHHNLSVQASGPPPQHHMTSKIKKLVSHKQIETNLNKRQAKFSKQKLSQTKNVLQQNRVSQQNQGRSSRPRKTNSKSKSNSKSRSSGQRTYSGSSKHLKSRSNQRSGSDNRRNMYNELAQYSFDLIDGDQVNINATSAHQLMIQHSKNDLQRQVLENQKTILGLLSKQRAGSNDSRKSRSQNRKKSQQLTGLSNMQDLVPKKQNTSQKNQRLSQNNMSINSQAQILKQAQMLASQQHLLEPHLQFGSNQTQLINGSQGMENDVTQVNRGRSKGNRVMQNSASQHVQGLSNFIKQIGTSKRSEHQVNKSLQYLKKQQKMMNYQKNSSQPPRAKIQKRATKDQPQQIQMGQNNEFKQGLMSEIRHLQNRLQEHLKQASESSPNRHKSGSQKRSGGERSATRSRSRSPSQPTKALIPKKKSFGQLLAHSKNMNFTTNEVGQQFNESLLNMSTGENVKPSRAHATSKLAKRKIDNLMQHNNQVHREDKAAYNSFDEPMVTDLNGANQFAPQGQGNAHHSLSMFDSELSGNKVNQFYPLHHQLSQNAILAPQPLSQNYILGHNRTNDYSKQAQSSKQIAKPANLSKRVNSNVADKRHGNQNMNRDCNTNYRTNPHQQTKGRVTKY